MKQSDYAKHAGLSAGYVCKLAAKGCPMTTPAKADEWRRTHAWRSPRSRTPPSPPGTTPLEILLDSWSDATPEDHEIFLAAIGAKIG